MSEPAVTHALPTGGIEGAAVSDDGNQVLLRFLDSPVGVAVPRATLVNLVALAIDASAERLTDAGEESAVRAVRVGRFTVGEAGERIILALQTENGGGSVSFDLPRAGASELARLLGEKLGTG